MFSKEDKFRDFLFPPKGSKFFPFRVDPFSEGKECDFDRIAAPTLKAYRFCLMCMRTAQSQVSLHICVIQFEPSICTASATAQSDLAILIAFKDVTVIITKTRLYNFDPLNPHFYIAKLGFTGVYTIFLISAQKT